MKLASLNESKGHPEHVKSMSAHRGLAILYALVALCVLFLFSPQAGEGDGFALLGGVLLMVCLALLHGCIAFGAARKNPLARAASMLVAVLMLLAFPLGTLIGIYLLVNSNWSISETSA